MSGKKHSVNMTEGAIFKKIFLFALPLMATGILQSLYNAADSIVVGRFSGKEALAAVGSTSSAINLMINLFVGISSASCVIIARKFGAKNTESVSRAVHTSVALSLIGGILLMILGICAARPLMMAMGSPTDVIDLSVLYLRIYFAGIPVVLLYNFGSSILRAIGDTKRPMYFLIMSGIVNVGLNLLFVIKFKMGVTGVAIATITSQAIAAALVLYCLIKTNESYRLVPSKIRICKKELTEILYIGIPAGIQGSIFSISNVLIQSSINSVGKVAMAGSAASGGIESIVYIALNSFYHATLTFVSQNYGAIKFDRIRKGMVASCISAIAVGIAISTAVCIFAEELMSIYSDSPEVIASGCIRLRIICAAYFLCGLMEIGVGGLRGLGASMIPLIISISGVCGVRIMIVALCGPYHEMEDLNILYHSYWISWAVTAAAHFTAFAAVKKKCIADYEREIAVKAKELSAQTDY